VKRSWKDREKLRKEFYEKTGVRLKEDRKRTEEKSLKVTEKGP
jgi:hypothetical protein